MRDVVQFGVDVVGEETGRRYEGVFSAKVKLSLRDMLREDEVRRVTLGSLPAGASDLASAFAGAVAYLAVRLVASEKQPDWWRTAGGGLDLEDHNVVVQVNNKAVEAIQQERDAHAKAAEEARPELKAVVAKAA